MLAPTRWRLRRAVRLVNATLAHLGLEKHPDKTFIGRISRGFDFLGYHFSPAGLTMARATVQRHRVGSGTTLLAAERKRRRLIGTEIAPHYVDLTIRRWQKITGEQTVHVETGDGPRQ